MSVEQAGNPVSILIPAYAAETFIDRTLYFARGQTHRRLAILVSVDQCEDDTLSRAAAHAREDERVTVFAQTSRLGWAGNANFLLEKVTTPFFFLYFHDDVIVPQYVEKMLAALLAEPSAASAHCDMGHFGGRDDVSRGRAYAGSTVRRLLTFMLAPYRGSPLRSLMRSVWVRSLRLPERDGGVWANEPFLMELLATGPAVHVPGVLYVRWDQRAGGLTDGWRGLTPEALYATHRSNLARAIAVIEAVLCTESERRALLTACYLWALPRLLDAEGRVGDALFSGPADLHPALASIELDQTFDAHGSEIAAWAEVRLRAARADLATRRGAS